MSAVFFRADYDVPTLYISAYAGRLIEDVVALGYNVVDLHGVEATQANLFEALRVHSPIFCFLGGHGNPKALFGQGDGLVLEACVSDHVLEGISAHALSCSTAQVLGPSAKEKTCPVYFGWIEDVVFVVKDDYTTRPLEDPYAGSYFLPPMAGITKFLENLLAGATWQDAARSGYETTISRYNEQIAYWSASTDPAASTILTWLFWDRDFFICITREGIYRVAEVPLARKLLALGLMVAPLLLKA